MDGARAVRGDAGGTLAAMTRPCWLGAVTLALIAGCSGGADAPDAAAVIDAGGDGAIDPDGGVGDAAGHDSVQACVAWSLTARAATAIAVHDDPGPYNSARTVRIAIEYQRGDGEQAAMPGITRGPGTITIEPRVFAPSGPAGATGRARLIVPLVLSVGTWQVVAAAPSSVALTLTVGGPPPRPCGTTGACAMDCDCDQAAGERCLGGLGLGGGFTACARPCEVDRDCGGGAVCTSIPDGLFDTCSDITPECGPTVACPAGFACQVGACAPTFVLGQGTRHPCTCDGECAPGLRCVTGAATEVGRCEVACATGGPWCQGAHVCGPASADLSGLASTDSVCGWLGE